MADLRTWIGYSADKTAKTQIKADILYRRYSANMRRYFDDWDKYDPFIDWYAKVRSRYYG